MVRRYGSNPLISTPDPWDDDDDPRLNFTVDKPKPAPNTAFAVPNQAPNYGLGQNTYSPTGGRRPGNSDNGTIDFADYSYSPPPQPITWKDNDPWNDNPNPFLQHNYGLGENSYSPNYQTSQLGSKGNIPQSLLDILLGGSEQLVQGANGRGGLPGFRGGLPDSGTGSGLARNGGTGGLTKGGMLHQYSPELDQYNGSLDDYFNQILSMIGPSGDGGVGAVDNRIAAAKANNEEANARIAALYKALGSDLTAALPVLEQSVESSQNAARAQTDLSQEAINDVKSENRENAMETLDATGIGDSALLQQGRQQAVDDSNFNTGELQKSAADQANYMANTLAANQTTQQGQINGAAYAGTNAQVDNERNLLNTLAGLEDERLAAQQSAAGDAQAARTQALQMALGMDDTAYNRFRDQQAYDLELDNTAYDRAYNEAQNSGESGMDIDQMKVVLDNLPEGSPIRSMIISQILGMDPTAYSMVNQKPVTRMPGNKKATGIKLDAAPLNWSIDFGKRG